jgi:hypothetical protein
MKVALVAVTVLLAVASSPIPVRAKAATVKIVIQGSDISTPIEITDPKVLAAFSIWTGNKGDSFIVRWPEGIAATPKGLPRYKVSFYLDNSAERPSYVVFYSYDPATKLGYVYLPGPGEKWYYVNMGSISRDGAEGNWYHARPLWDAIVKPLIVSSPRTSR